MGSDSGRRDRSLLERVEAFLWSALQLIVAQIVAVGFAVFYTAPLPVRLLYVVVPLLALLMRRMRWTGKLWLFLQVHAFPTVALIGLLVGAAAGLQSGRASRDALSPQVEVTIVLGLVAVLLLLSLLWFWRLAAFNTQTDQMRRGYAGVRALFTGGGALVVCLGTARLVQVLHETSNVEGFSVSTLIVVTVSATFALWTSYATMTIVNLAASERQKEVIAFNVRAQVTLLALIGVLLLTNWSGSSASSDAEVLRTLLYAVTVLSIPDCIHLHYVLRQDDKLQIYEDHATAGATEPAQS